MIINLKTKFTKGKITQSNNLPVRIHLTLEVYELYCFHHPVCYYWLARIMLTTGSTTIPALIIAIENI